ncbi:MAG: rhamnogalacturonan acetylesterase [Clostridia bacterium]|nr:rhamnogalacturonan acetylesterase [Clostridia bacterium]
MKIKLAKKVLAGMLSACMILASGIVTPVSAAGEVSLNENFSNYEGNAIKWSNPNNYSDGVRVGYANAVVDNFPAVAATDVLDGRSGGYMKMVTTSDFTRPYVYIYLNNDTNGWDQTSAQKSVLSIDFALSAADVPLFIGGQLAYGESFLKYRNSSGTVLPFLQISSTSATAWGNTITLKETLSVNKWHTAKLYSNGDKTFTLYIDDTIIFANQAFNDSGINYLSGSTSVTAPTTFEGFSQLWLYCGSAKEADKSIYYDNLSLSVEDGHFAGLYTEDFSTYEGGLIQGNWKTNDGYDDVTAYINGTTDTFPTVASVTSTGAIDGKTESFLPIYYTSANPRAYVGLSPADKENWASSASGASKLSVDFALSDTGSPIYIGGYVLYYDESKEIKPLMYRDNTQTMAAIMKISGTEAEAWGNSVTLGTTLETNRWYTATMYINGDKTFSMYIDDTPVFVNTAFNNTNREFYEKNSETTVTPGNFIGFTELRFQRGTKNDTAKAVYYDNISLSKQNSYYVADTSSEDLVKVQAAADALQIYTEQVENGLALDSLGLNETSITWKSSNTSVITDKGIVYPCIGEEKTVTMTATVTLNSTSITKDFKITVPAVNPYKITGVKITGDDGIVDNALVGGKTVSKVSVKRYSESADKIIVLTALYKQFDDYKELKDVKVNKVAPAMEQYAYGDIELTNKITLPEDVSDYKLKVMIWDSAWALNNLADDYTVELEDNSITVYTAGDSTVQTYSANYAPQEGWGQNLADFLINTATVDNSRSMGGRSARSFVAEERLKYIADRIQPGDYLLVQFGHNDVKTDETKSSLTGSPIIRNTTINDEYNSYAKYLEMYVDMAQEKGANVILVTSVNRVKDRTGENLEGYPEAMRAFAEEKNVPILDLTAKSIELQKELDAAKIAPENLYLYWRAGDIRFDFTGSTQYSNVSDYADGTHFNAYGAKCIAQLIAKELKEIGSPLSRFVDESTYFDVINNMPKPLYE